MEQKSDFVIEPFKPRKHDFRSDKGKRHNYPKERKRWNPRICQRQSKTNLSKYDGTAQEDTMGRKFKGTPSMRRYWREQKRRQRQRKRRG